MKEKKTYDTQSYASQFSPDQSIYFDDSRIFHRNGFEYNNVKKIKSSSFLDGTLNLKVELDDGGDAFIMLSWRTEDTLRITLSRQKKPLPEHSTLIGELIEACTTSTVQEDDTEIKFVFGSNQVVLRKHPFQIIAGYFSLANDQIAGEYPVSPLGFRQHLGQQSPYLSWNISNDEFFYGLGEKWNKVEKTSTKSTIWCTDTCGSNTTDLSYKPYPLIFSTKGWGLLNLTSYKGQWEIGTFSYPAGSFLTEDPELDVFLFLAPTLKGLLNAYTRLAGRPLMPPKWALGVWMSRCAYEKYDEAKEAVDGLIAHDIPADVIHLDPIWMKTHYYFKIGVDACDFVRNDEGFPDLPNIFKEFREKGFDTCLWINPYLPEGSEIYGIASENGYLLKSLKGGIARLSHGEPVGMVDFTNPKAYEWWKGYLRELFIDGAGVVKPDYGDRVPEDAVNNDGMTGLELHNLYMHLYAKASFEACVEVRGEENGMVWRRSGFIGSQRYPGTWAGDTQATWEGLKHCMRGGLSAGMSGEAFWTSDIGGFVGAKPSAELYIRWMQFGMLNGLTRFHGTTPREPWHFGDIAVENTRHYAKLRYRLLPYLMNCAKEATQTGMPMMRHMKLEFQDQPGMEYLDDQYMLGSDLLIAPVILEGALTRTLFLPEGNWSTLEEEGILYEGGRYVTTAAPLNRIPIFVRGGVSLPMYETAPRNTKDKEPAIIYKMF